MFVYPDGNSVPATFHAMALGSEPVTFLARARSAEPASLATPLRVLVDEVGLGRGLTVTPMGEYYGIGGGELRLMVVIPGVIALSVLLLSAAGISAMMSFAVTRRQREIGVRTALGATKAHVIASVFRRSAVALTAGALLGATLSVLVDRAAGGEMLGGQTVPLLAVVGSITLVTAALATLAPARRALRLQAMDLMRGE
jgi:ABC-type lipoprotein release transport system permease subunit